MTLFNLIESGAAAKARTNMLKLPGDINRIIHRLSAPGDGNGQIQGAVVEVSQKFGEENAEYWQRVDSTIKDFIRKTLGIPASTGVHYSRFSARRGVFGFLYLSNRGAEPDQVCRVIAEHSLNPFHAIQALLHLNLKLSYLNDVHKNYEIAPVEYNANLYLGLVFSNTAKNGNDVFEALEYDLYFSTAQELVVRLTRAVMECTSQDSVSRPVTESGMLMFEWGGKRFKQVRSLNATSSDRNYMAFVNHSPKAKPLDHYHNSINYHQTDCLNRLERLLGDAGVEFSPVVYQATHQVTAFLEGLPPTANPLLLLDTAEHLSGNKDWLNTIDDLAEKFGASKVVRADSLPAPTELEVGTTNYLVVSEKVKVAGKSKNGSSIFQANIEGEQAHNSFWQALNAYQRNPGAVFDYYTSVKLHRFTARVDTVSQGLNVFPKKSISAATIEKSLQELALKESIFSHKAMMITGATLPVHSLQLVSCRSDRNKNVYIQVLDVTVDGETIKVENSRRFDETSKGEFNHEFKQMGAVIGKPAMKAFDALWNDAFLIRDKASNSWLNAYNTLRVPAIIGNTLFDNQELQDSGLPPSRTVAIDVAPLPYYLTPFKNKQRHKIFIQDNGSEGAWFFVSSSQATNGTIVKQSLTYNAVVTDDAGRRLPVLTHPLGKLFFSSFTYDIVKLREAAKSSIFQKIVNVCLHN